MDSVDSIGMGGAVVVRAESRIRKEVICMYRSLKKLIFSVLRSVVFISHYAWKSRPSLPRSISTDASLNMSSHIISLICGKRERIASSNDFTYDKNICNGVSEVDC